MRQPTSLFFALSILFLASCDFSHDEVNEEPITSALFTLTPDTGTVVVLSFLDRDGVGGQPAIVNAGSLLSHTRYQAQLLLNTLGKHLMDTTSIAKNPEDYQVFFLPQNGLEVQTEYRDLDENGFPVGLSSVITTNQESEGLLTIIIKHKPNKNAAGVWDGDITNAGGKTSFEVSFELSVKQE